VTETEESPIKRLILPLIAIIGLIDSFHLISIYFQPDVCTQTGSFFSIPLDCGTVARSEYSSFLGIPVAIYGVIFYVSIILVVMYQRELQFLPITPYQLLALQVTTGQLVSLVLFYIQIFVVKAICVYCMLSFCTATSMFIIFLYLRNFFKTLA